MLYRYDQALVRFGSAYQISKAVDSRLIYKVERGLYSDERHPNPNTVVCALYPQAVLTMETAFYLHGLTDVASDVVHVATPRNATRIRNEWVRQHFMEPVLMNCGVVAMNKGDGAVRVFSRERMLIELMRASAGMSPDYYKELIISYRAIANELDMREIEDCLALYSRADALFDKMQKEVL